MKIGIYIPDVTPQAGGASSLLKTVQKEIEESHDPLNEYLFLYYGQSSRDLLEELDGFKYVNLNYYKNSLSLKQRLKNKIKQKLGVNSQPFSKFDAAAKDIGLDLFWFTAPGTYDVSFPYIYTVWDLGHRRTPYFPEVSRSGWSWQNRESTYQNMLYKASFILTGNEEGKKEILENYSVPSGKIRISSFPVASFCRGEERKPSFDIPEQFFFYPAQFWPHKNHICILESLVILREKYGLKPTVFFTGSDKGNKKYIESKIIEFGLENQVHFTGFLKDEELKWLYTHATAMIFASLMGPNNMPPVEATYLNCPVIITDLDGHKEQLQDTALYFNGYKPDELSEHIRTLLTEKDTRDHIIEKEKVLAREFDKINYFSCIKQIIDEFALIRKTWGEDFIHL
jgi:glycosyltransferase involved in cell wall biosynthesis